MPNDDLRFPFRRVPVPVKRPKMIERKVPMGWDDPLPPEERFVQWADPGYPSPTMCLALDEMFLLQMEAGQHPNASGLIWFWESPVYVAVVGYGQKREREVDLEACARRRIPVLRRCSGGGAVLQGPGCLSYGLVLPITPDGPLASIRSANAWIMERQRRGIEALMDRPVSIAGHTDLVIDGRKFSGNSQRRLRNHLLFHGTFLYNFDLRLMSELLRPPSIAPEYRAGREHRDFVTNLKVDPSFLKAVLRKEWRAKGARLDPSRIRLRELCDERYDRPEWHALR